MLLPYLRSLRYYRELHLLSQRELAERSGVSRSTIIRAEQLSIAPKPAIGLRLARFFGITLEQLVAKPPRQHPSPSDWLPELDLVAV